MLDFRKEILTDKYDFVRTNPHLGNRIILLGLGGSYAYGTNSEDSDLDIRGIALQGRSDLIGLTEFEQFTDTGTDTVIYGFNKVVRLLLKCTPNVLEILGLDDDQYIIKTDIGQELLDNKALFLTKRAARSFGGYADSQLRRLQNAIARDSMPQAEREEHILKSVKRDFNDLQERLSDLKCGTMKIYTDKAQTSDKETEIFIDAEFKHLPLRDYKNILVSMNNVIKDYDQVGSRNHKKDDDHLNKHAMHLIRLYMMAIDIMEKGEIRTHRSDDLDILLAIRGGEFMTSSGVMSADFYKLVDEYEKKMDRAVQNSILPDEPDLEKVAAFVENVNRRTLDGEF